MSTQLPLVSIIVLNYNGWPLLKQCLPTVLHQDYEHCEIIVVDNGSSDQSVELIKKYYPTTNLIALKKNQGFAGANNRGVEQAQGQYVLLVSNDIELSSGCVTALITAFRENPELAVAGPKVHNLNMDMNKYPKNGTLSVTGIMIDNVFNDPTQVFGIAGCAVMFDKHKMDLPFDDDYEFFHEDVYLSWRARILGYQISLVSKVMVIHVGEATVKSMGEHNRYLMERNRLLNLYTFYSADTLKKIRVLLWMTKWLQWGTDLIRGRSRQPIEAAWQWLAGHQRLIKEKNERMQQIRQRDDESVTVFMSGKIINSNKWPACWLNHLAMAWCRWKKLPVWELGPSR